MTIKNQNFSMYAGETKEIKATITKEDGTSLDLTGAKLVWSLRKGELSSVNILTKTTAGGSITTAGNVATIKLSSVDTKELVGADFFHELWAEDQTGNDSALFMGKAKILFSSVKGVE